MDRERWWESARCYGEDLDLFFDEERVREAKVICNQCSVIEECLKDALHFERKQWRSHGIRAGLTARQRSRLLNQRRGTGS